MQTAITLHPHQMAEAYDRNHRTIISIGGVGSGKSFCDGLWVLDRASFDAEQLHGLFCNTVTQLENGVLPEIFKVLDLAGVEYEYNHEPPPGWREDWRARGIIVPPKPGNFRRILTLRRSGLHVLCGTLHNRSHRQYRSLQFGSAKIEEFTNGPALEGVEFIAERVRCGNRSICARKHRHQLYLTGNPPDDPSHWIFDYLNRMETAAERKGGIEIAREPGTYPLLAAGVGSTVLIQSSTWDNAENLAEGYAEGLAENYDSETAQRRLGGQLLRIATGRAAESFSAKNIIPIHYDPNRTVYVCLDFDMEPAVAAFAHPLKRGEYPDEWYRSDREVIGVFGEYVNTDGISVQRLAEMLVTGDRGSGCNYRNERLRGLPENWQGLRGQAVRFIAFGDATGNQRSKTSYNLESSWQIVDQIFRQVVDGSGRAIYGKDVADFNPAPRARLHTYNARLESYTKVVSFFFDPRCEQLIADNEQCVWGEEGIALKKWSKRAGGILYVRGHLLDAVSYLTHRRFPMGADVDPLSTMPKVIRRASAKVPSYL